MYEDVHKNGWADNGEATIELPKMNSGRGVLVSSPVAGSWLRRKLPAKPAAQPSEVELRHLRRQLHDSRNEPPSAWGRHPRKVQYDAKMMHLA